VRKGETVASIAKRYKVSTSTIISFNNINSKKGLAVGQKLRIPIIRTTRVVRTKPDAKSKRSSGLAEAKQLYKVKKGDTLLLIAKRFDLPVAQLKEMNKLKKNSLRAGQVLKLSRQETSEETGEDKKKTKKEVKKEQIAGKTLSAADMDKLGTNKYIVTKGDNLSIIARKNKIDVAKLAKLNKLSGDETLTPGQLLIIK
jgi:membrane-bound lytic murein transglycosylase D